MLIRGGGQDAGRLMKETTIMIVGAGLAGLYAAYRLEQCGMQDYLIVEARAIPGGRIGCAVRANSTAVDRFDLGPTWFWPTLQPQLNQLVQGLGLKCFPQHEQGEMLLERAAVSAPARMRGYVSEPPGMRLVGGMQSLVDSICGYIDPQRIRTGRRAKALRYNGERIEIDSEEGCGRRESFVAKHVWLALPPRIAARDLEFEPELPHALQRQWSATPTWMAPHAKYLAVYDRPFWREDGLSGEARSLVGPLGEIHDASMPGGSAALFGFFSLPANQRCSEPIERLYANCREQLIRLFGLPAAAPAAEFIKDWALEPFIATHADWLGVQRHADSPDETARFGSWQGRLRGIASEWSTHFPGYLAGAIEAAEGAVMSLTELNPR